LVPGNPSASEKKKKKKKKNTHVEKVPIRKLRGVGKDKRREF